MHVHLQVVGPGDQVQPLPVSGSIRIGAGLRTQEGFVVSQKCGVVRQTRNGKLWLEGRQKRYAGTWPPGAPGQALWQCCALMCVGCSAGKL